MVVGMTKEAMKPPVYFSEIERRARDRWEQLERDPDLAGPWHQLFRQVQSPRHVLSELLQNADDAGAKAASVRIQNDTFIFKHDGADFDKEQFTSLCRFGFSHKRTLHTIGFRGIGFKSTFSLGNTVEVRTPTIAISFSKKRFTLPVWLDDAKPSDQTVIQVTIGDRNRANELRKNFEEWAESPASLLFFNNLKELTIEGQTIRNRRLSAGPVPNSSWVKLAGADTRELLVVRSEPARLPDEAVQEIHAERSVGAEDLHLPPCYVELVFGLSDPQRLYVVLPTGAQLNLPFSCNAPFIQDPARFAIKDPATSPTNRWLLERVGRLAAQVMVQWLENQALSCKDRAAAYGLLRKAGVYAPDLNGACTQIVLDTMLAQLNNQRFILNTEAKLVKNGTCAAVPVELHSVWEPDQLTKLFAPDNGHLLAAEVSASARDALHSYSWLNVVDADDVFTRLEESADVPRPAAWPKLHALWSFVQSGLEFDWDNEHRRAMKLVPVVGDPKLHAADQVIRLSSKRDLLAPADWKFITSHALTVDADWVTWISARAPKKSAAARENADAGYVLLQALSLHEPSSVDRIAAQASLRIFTGKNITVADCVRITHIMAALGAAVPEGFHYVSKDLHLREPGFGVVLDDAGRVQDLVPEAWAQEHILHEDYSRNFTSCKAATWNDWVQTEGSGLLIGVPIVEIHPGLYNRASVKRFATARGGDEPGAFHYQRDDFHVEDYGLPPDLMKHWEKPAKEDPSIWARVLEGILAGPSHNWTEKTEAQIRHLGRSYRPLLDCGTLASEWIMHFRSVACLPDIHGKLHIPAELLLRTPDTEPLMNIEPFVRPDLDVERTKPLLRLLGVRSTPTHADNLLERLRALSGFRKPDQHLSQISRIYEALDRVVLRCRPEELETIIEAFQEKALILTTTGEWAMSHEVSIFPEDGEDSPTVHPSFRNLGLWPRVDVSERPALERTIEWLKSLKSGTKLDAAGLRRVRAAIQREPFRIWNECGHWPSLESTWEPVTTFQFRLTMQGLMKWGELSPAIRRGTADLRNLAVEQTQTTPFSQICDLGDAVELRVTKFVEDDGKTRPTEWLEELATGLCRIMLPIADDTGRVRNVARRLYVTRWHPFRLLEVTPYVDGVPAGESFTPKTLWQEHSLYVGNYSSARIHKELADELSRPFALPAISEAIAACIDRNREFVSEYLNSHFNLDPNLSLSGLDAEKAKAAAVPQPDGGQTDGEQKHDQTEGDLPEPDATAEPGEQPTEDTGGVTEPQEAKPRPPVPREPTLIERYARQRGFRWHDAEKAYVHPDGRSIQKSETPFNWEEHAADGNVVRRLWVSDQKLSAGIEIAADLWSLISQKPDETGVIIAADDHSPFPLTGQEILELKDSKQITLFPSRYRIVESQ